MKILNKLLPILVVLTMSFWAIKPLLNTGFYPMHDDTQVARVFEMHKALTDGMFPVRWVEDLGYGFGYPIFNFYAPLAYYVGAKFMLLGLNALTATKLMIGLGTVLAGIFMHFIAKEFWGKIGGIISALLYVYAPYHALNIYVRGAVAELWAYAFIPLVFFSVYKVYENLKSYSNSQKKLKLNRKETTWLWVCLTSVSYAAIVLSHNLTAMMVTPFVFVYSVFLYIKLRMADNFYKSYFVLFGLLIGILLSAFYFIPVLFEMKYTNVLSVVGGGSNYKDHFACLSQLWNSTWGFAGSAPGCTDGFSLRVGKLHILLGLISLPALIPLYKNDRSKFQTVSMFVIFLLFSVFLSINQSRILWDTIPHMAFFQFPWRFLVIISFFTSFVGGGFFWLMEKKVDRNTLYKYFYWSAAITTIAVIIVVYSKIFIPQEITHKNSKEYTSKQELNWRVSKISDEYLPQNFAKPYHVSSVPRNKIVSNKNIKIISQSAKTNRILLTVEVIEKTDLQINLAYFPGWHVYVDDQQITFKYSNFGILVPVDKGNHKIEIRYSQTPIQKIGNVFSVIGMSILVIGIIRRYKN